MSDLIDRQAAIDAAREWYNSFLVGGFMELEKRLKQLPSAFDMAIEALKQPERKKGKWIDETKHHKDDEQDFYYCETRCSECGAKRRIGWHGARYCPMCGSYNGGKQE